MPNFYRRCHACGQADPTTRWREDNLAALCIACHVDARRNVEAHPVTPTAALCVPMGDLVRFSPAAQAALARLS